MHVREEPTNHPQGHSRVPRSTLSAIGAPMGNEFAKKYATERLGMAGGDPRAKADAQSKRRPTILFVRGSGGRQPQRRTSREGTLPRPDCKTVPAARTLS